MADKIQVEAVYTPDDFARAGKYLQNRGFIARYAFLIPIVILSIMLLINYLANPPQFIAAFSKPDKLAIIIIPMLFLIIWHFYRRNKPSFITRRAYNNHFNSSPALREPKLTAFDEEGIFATSQFGSSLQNWDSFVAADETEDDFYFFTSKKIASFVPKRFFNFEQLNQIQDLTKRKLGDKARF